MPITALLKFAERFPAIATVESAAIIVTLWWWSGGNVDPLTVDAHLWQGQVWRLFSAALPHVNILHLAFNLYCVAVFGSLIEQAFGTLVTALWIFVLAAGSMVAEYALADGAVGLSGVAYGFFGMLWVLSKRDRRFAGAIDAQTTRMFVGWFFLCLALTVTDVWRIGNVAHAAGAGFGALAGLVMSPPVGHRRQTAVVLLVGALTAVIAAGSFARPYVNFTGAAGYELARQAYEALQRDDADAAVAALEKAVRQRNAEAGWWHNLGIAYQRQRRRLDAARAFRRAYDLDPADSEALQAAESLEAAAPAIN